MGKPLEIKVTPRTQAYRDNWEAIFEKPELCAKCGYYKTKNGRFCFCPPEPCKHQNAYVTMQIAAMQYCDGTCKWYCPDCGEQWEDYLPS